MVSDADEIGVIHRRIIQQLYTSEIIVCDVSGKNANVMFELGMRLAFDKPVVIVKDDKTDYSFDTSIIEHLTYPRDLRFSQIVEFKTLLAQKIESTYRATKKPNHETFLKSFGTFHVASLKQDVASPESLIFEAIGDLSAQVAALRRDSARANADRIRKHSEPHIWRVREILIHLPTTRLEQGLKQPRKFIEEFKSVLPPDFNNVDVLKHLSRELTRRQSASEGASGTPLKGM